MKNTAVLLALLLLAGCQTPDQKFAAYEAEREAYMTCGHSSAARLAANRPGTDPIAVAVAAKSQCGEERASLMQAIQKAHDYSIWSQMIGIYDRKFIEVATAAAFS
ncbi:hypothetical protein [Ciceribacter sp. T2.26MG-112.2]|uniref:hypothetical protein n=1 Tax=Ciceribacter sp. T2.26MG-112.2 TaxID=3137154 RepID=UPI0012B69565|nr:hypothetical protein [Ciceribacter naphthalenivorans]